VPVADAVTRYAVDVVRATRPDDASSCERVRAYLGYGAAERQGVADVVEAWLEEELGGG